MSQSESTETTVPEKYSPEPRKYEDKDWLYQEYWGKTRSAEDIGAECDVSEHTIRRALDEHGIPHRHVGDGHRTLLGFRPEEDDTSVDWSEYRESTHE